MPPAKPPTSPSTSARVIPFPTCPLRLVILRTASRQPLFGTIHHGRFHPTRLGALARQFWLSMPLEYPAFGFEWCQVQPSAVVAVIRAPRSPGRDLLRAVVAHYKALVTRSSSEEGPVWSPGFEAAPVAPGAEGWPPEGGHGAPGPRPPIGIRSGGSGSSSAREVEYAAAPVADQQLQLAIPGQVPRGRRALGRHLEPE